MKKLFALPALLVLASVSSFGAQSESPYSSQFNLPHQPKHQIAATSNHLSRPVRGVQETPNASRQGHAHFAHAKSVSKNGPSATTAGFVSATQIPAGGAPQQQTFKADVNGDGKSDIVSLVYNSVSGNSVYSISVALGNGDGTFQSPALTTLPNNDPVLVGDLNGDGKADVVQIHLNAPSNFDVWISDSNGDAKFTHALQGATFSISDINVLGGVLTDLNGDGKLDLLAIDVSNPGQVWHLLGNGDGTFQNGTSTALTTFAPDGLVFADFNGDGKIDFAGLNYTSEQVDVYLQSSSGFTFTQAGSSLLTPNAVYDTCNLAAGDLTGDGRAEIVSTNCGDQNLTVYVNNGDGTFQTGVYYGSAAAPNGSNANVQPRAATIADVNGDGKADIVVSNRDGSDVTVLLGHGDGTVTVPTVGYAVGGYPRHPPLVGDFNGDGLPDILVADDEFSYVYLKGYGDGTFRSALNYYAEHNGFGENIVSADLNGDGKPDFVMSNCCDTNVGVTVFLSRPDGSLQPGVNYGSGGNLDSVVVADFNGDGKLDIAAADRSAVVVRLFFGSGNGTFTPGSTTFSTSTSEASPYGMVGGDFNHDGKLDLAVCNGFDIGVLLGDGAGNFSAPTNYSLSQFARDVTAADVNGDGYLDLIAPLNASASNGIALFLGKSDNSGTFNAETDVAAGFNYNYSAAVADLNGDGKVDLAFTVEETSNGQGVAVALGNGDGTFQTPTLFPTSLQDANIDRPYPSYLKIFDLNGDGKPDLILTNAEYGTVATLFGVGDGTFSAPLEYPSGGYAFGLALADVNGDGATDVITAGDDFLGATVLLNNSGSGTLPTFTVGAVSSTATVPAGTPASYTLNLTGQNGYSGTVTFACSGLPAKATCSFNPASVAVSGSTPFTTTLTITTTAARNSDPDAVQPGPKTNGTIFWQTLSGLGLFGMCLAGGVRKNRRHMAIVLGVLLPLMVAGLTGCGSTIAGTPKGTYTVTVTATGTGSNAPIQTMPLTLVVQ